MKTIYLDNNATTSVAPEVLEAMMPYFTDQYFNPSSRYASAERVAHAVLAARESIAAFLHCTDAEELIFTSCATESNNAALYGAIRANPCRRHIVTSAVEHPAVREVCIDLAGQGFEVTVLPVDGQGAINLEEFRRSLRPDTLLVSIMHANNETGVVFPIAELAGIAKNVDPSILFHTDATQSVGKLTIDLSTDFSHVDLLSFSGHKLHAPKGIGCLYVRKGTPWRPFLLGGHQENGLRAGTENTAYIIGLAQACELAHAHRREQERISNMRDSLEARIRETIPFIRINGEQGQRLSNTSNISFHGVEAESILFQLERYGICASSGSACSTGTLEPSHVLQAMAVPEAAIHGSVRFSLSRYTTEEEIETLIRVLPEIIRTLRSVSPSWMNTAKE